MRKKGTVVVAMSGGVDSSVSAALLVSQGYTVIGMMLTLWSEKGQESANRCCTPDSQRLAKAVAAQLNIPFYTIDAKQDFYNAVVTPFMQDYLSGFTPNPCLRCNRMIRWGVLFENARQIGADYFATGHYAILRRNRANQVRLFRARDESKDQSYVLHVLQQTELEKTLFPVGNYLKSEVRQLAIDLRLPIALRRDSQDLCFLGGSDYRDFLKRNTPQSIQPGKILDKNGNLLGEHQGLPFYTIGQRKNLGINSTKPLYVIQKDRKTNSIIIGDKEDTLKREFVVKGLNWINDPPQKTRMRVGIKVRYRAPILNGIIEIFDDDRVAVTLDDPYYDITPGQAAVFYVKDRCLGGGLIAEEPDLRSE